MIEFIIIGVLAIVVIILLVFMNRTQSAIKGLKDNQPLNLMQQQIGQLTTQVNQQLQGMSQQFQNTSGNIDSRLDKAALTISGVSEKLGVLSESTKRIIEAQKNIVELQELLKPPKFRGELGEFFLENLLAQILPKSYYTCQYLFKSGAKVDAVIHLRDRIVSVDSKFPLESFERIIKSKEERELKTSRREFIKAIKKHISDIAEKYILPDEKTYDFALMYIPAENVYYEVIIKSLENEENSIFSYALEKKVIPVSPNSFYAYLQVVIEGLRGFHIEKWAQEIRQSISRLQGDFTKFKEDFDVAGKHLTNAKNKFDESERKLVQLEDKLSVTVQLPDEETKNSTEQQQLSQQSKDNEGYQL